MRNWISKNYKTLIISAFLIPIITVALVSISHVTKWYGISNPVSWAIYLSIGIEIAALSALAAISADMGRKVYFPFGIVTLIQFIGNIYFAYSYIDITSQAFISWVELVSPLIEFIGVDPTDMVGHKRFLAFFAGGMLPIISLSFLHMLVKFTQSEKNTVEVEQPVVKDTPEPVGEETPVVDAKDIVGEVSRVRISQEDLDILEKLLNKTPKTETPQESFEEESHTPTKEEKDDVFLIEDHLIGEEIAEPIVPEPQITEVSVTVEPVQEIIEQPIVEETPIQEESVVVVEEQPIHIEEPVIVTDGLLDAQPPIFEEQLVIIEPELVVIEEPVVIEPEVVTIEEPVIVKEPVVIEPEPPVVTEEPQQDIIEQIEELPIEEEKKN